MVVDSDRAIHVFVGYNASRAFNIQIIACQIIGHVESGEITFFQARRFPASEPDGGTVSQAWVVPGQRNASQSELRIQRVWIDYIWNDVQ